MRRFLLAPGATLLPLLLGVTCPAQLEWTDRTIEVTAERNETQTTVRFPFRNVGTKPVTILVVHSSCGCTTIELPKRTYAPGEGGEIAAVYTVGDARGVQRKTVTVTTDHEPAKAIELTLQVTIPHGIVYTPRVLTWRLGDRLAEKEVGLQTGAQGGIAAVEITAVTPAESALVQVQRAGDGRSFRLQIRPRSTLKAQQSTITGLATLQDGSKEPFSFFALVR